jgi:hypothetical protein
MALHGEMLRISPRFLPSLPFWRGIRKEKSVSLNDVSHIALQLPSYHHHVEIYGRQMILQYWKDRALSMSDRGCFKMPHREAVELPSGNGTVQPSVVMYRRTAFVRSSVGLTVDGRS